MMSSTRTMVLYLELVLSCYGRKIKSNCIIFEKQLMISSTKFHFLTLKCDLIFCNYKIGCSLVDFWRQENLEKSNLIVLCKYIRNFFGLHQQLQKIGYLTHTDSQTSVFVLFHSWRSKVGLVKAGWSSGNSLLLKEPDVVEIKSNKRCTKSPHLKCFL